MSRPAPNAHRGGRGDGFLLTETLASFTLSAFVLLGLASGAAVLLRAIDRSAARVQEVDDLGRALDSLGRDMARVRRARWSGEEPQPFVFSGGPNSLTFVAGGGAAKRVVSLRVIPVGDGSLLTRSEATLPADARSFADLRFGPARPVPAGPVRLRFSYAPALRSGVPVPARVTSWPSGTTLPEAVIVDAVNAATGQLIVADRLPLGADGDIGCLVARGSGGNASDNEKNGAGASAAGGGGGAAGGGTASQPQDSLAVLMSGLNGGGGGASAAPAAAVARPPREPERDFCGRADKDDKMDGSGPRPEQGGTR